ncbi:MAG TPA: hypothetical protein VG944_14560 [Fimbriimonas sp.]|nr:hypothetical protein [Fimbriimonas sp.]
MNDKQTIELLRRELAESNELIKEGALLGQRYLALCDATASLMQACAQALIDAWRTPCEEHGEYVPLDVSIQFQREGHFVLLVVGGHCSRHRSNVSDSLRKLLRDPRIDLR